MNYALIIAGGSGNRMGQDIPKQFIEIGGLPILMRATRWWMPSMWCVSTGGTMY